MTAATKLQPEPRERPILFKGEMVRAILEGRKTQTRRVVKPMRGFEHNNICAPHLMKERGKVWMHGPMTERVGCTVPCPYGVPGDRLWVRETFYDDCFRDKGEAPTGPDSDVYYRADVPSGRFEDAGYWGEPGGGWKPSIFMPRWASRISLPITSIRVERLQDISEEDAKAEGIACVPFCPDDGFPVCDGYTAFPGVENSILWPTAREAFFELWRGINGEETLRSNPWAWVVGWDKAEVRP